MFSVHVSPPPFDQADQNDDPPEIVSVTGSLWAPFIEGRGRTPEPGEAFWLERKGGIYLLSIPEDAQIAGPSPGGWWGCQARLRSGGNTRALSKLVIE